MPKKKGKKKGGKKEKGEEGKAKEAEPKEYQAPNTTDKELALRKEYEIPSRERRPFQLMHTCIVIRFSFVGWMI